MSFVISCVLAITTILATFMLQMADDDLNASSSVVGIVSFVAVLTALYFVDYRKKFALRKTACNILILLTVAFQIGALTRSRNEIIAFAIANILASLQAILFFQSKTLRKCYQILFISFVEVAVGCVFQRSSFFVASLPIYAILSFMCFSLLFLWGERKFYAERVVLKSRFSGAKNLELISAEEPIHQIEEKPLDPYDSAAALAYGKAARFEDSSRFFRRPSVPAIRFSFGYFRRFVVGALAAFAVAACFFCLFPRLHEFGFGALSFDEINWGGGRGGVTKTGFSPRIELGDLGPSLDSPEEVMTLRLVDCLDANNPIPLDPNAPIYLRGMPLANYYHGVWSTLAAGAAASDLDDLERMLRRSTVADPDVVLSYLKRFKNSSAVVPVRPQILAQFQPEARFVEDRPPRYGNDRRGFTPFSPGFNGSPAPQSPPSPNPTTIEMFRAPYSGNLARSLPNLRAFSGFRKNNSIDALADLSKRGFLDLNALKYDVRSDVVGYDVDLKPLDTKVVFAPSAFYVAKCFPTLVETSSRSIELFDDRTQRSMGGKFWFVSTAVMNRRQTILTPNQEVVWPYLRQYLEIDSNRFPKLIAQAQAWDKESGLRVDDFIGRARYLESRLRDSDAFQYNRSGVVRAADVDPLEDFISEHKEGHCEYFAGGLALLLRAVGIPSRVVVGYAVYPDSEKGATTIRQSDAHSWVEAYIPPDKLPSATDPDASLFPGTAKDANGQSCLPESNKEWLDDGMWLRLDPTPASDRDSNRPNALAIGMYAWSKLFSSFGRDFILNFNAVQQMRSVYLPILQLWRQCVEAIRSVQSAFGFVNLLFDQLKDTLKAMVSGDLSPGVVLKLAVLTVVVVFAFGAFRRIYRFVRKRLASRRDAAERDATRRDGPVALLYRRLEKFMENKLRLERRASETPREFIERCFVVEDELAKRRREGIPFEEKTAPKKGLFGRFRKADRKATEELSEPTPEATRGLFRELVELYYGAQFGDKKLAPQEAERWSAALKAAQIA